MTEYSFIVEQRHIDIRNRAAFNYKDSSLFRGACELPEYHQCDVDPNQTLTVSTQRNGYRAGDTEHKLLGIADYKIDHKDGPYMGDDTVKNIDKGIVKIIVVWSWITWPNDGLKVNDRLSYKIKGWIDAKEALALRDPVTKRFKYKKLNVL
jgi:hypothetical protein